MSLIDTSMSVPRVAAAAAAMPTMRPRSQAVAERARDDATSLPPASSLRVRMSAPHAASIRLERTAAVADIADDALGRTHDLLREASGLMSQDEPAIDGFLSAIDETTSRPLFAGAPTLQDGITLNAGPRSLELRPVSSSDLGAIVDSGRSYRLIDVRSGGMLDARAHPGAAHRSAGIAMDEVSALRSQLRDFRATALDPARIEVASALSAVQGSISEQEARAAAAETRAELLNRTASRREMTVDSAQNVLALLTSSGVRITP